MLNLTLERIERQIRNLPVEHVYVLGPDNEVLFHHTDNLPNQVTYPRAVLAANEISVVTHNHPGGRSFSTKDLLLARDAALPQLRVVTARNRYSLHPPADGWDSLENARLEQAIEREEALLKAQIDAEIRRSVTTTELAGRDYHHRLCKRLEVLGLIRYGIERW